MQKQVTGSEHWACGWQNYTVDGWIYPYHSDKLEIKFDKDGQEYIRFILSTPRMFGARYYFFPVMIFGKSMCNSLINILNIGDFVQVIGYWHQDRVKLASYNGKTRLRDWNHIVATRINKMPHVRSRKEIEEYRVEHGSRGLPITIEEIRNEKNNPFK